MKTFFNKYKYLFLTCLASLAIFYKSLFVFFTNDDFFFLKISNVNGVSEFFNFFNLFKGPDGFGMYRPLTTQVFYFMAQKLLGTNPLYLHVISFLTFFGIIFLVYKLVFELCLTHLTKDESIKIANITAFLYAVSATHFGQLYYSSVFQELGVTLFVLLSCLSYVKQKNLLSFAFFILALMSKETAVVTPALLFIIYLFQKFNGGKVANLKKMLLQLFPYLLTLAIYLLLRFCFYGFATGDSYVWDFSIKKFINTTAWYLAWALNLPESLVDFVGPGIKINANLFLYWGKQVTPILISFIIQCILLVIILVKVILEKSDKEKKGRDLVSTFCIAWFALGLLPVVFLPLHKFTFYLTLPLIGLTFRIAYLLVTSKSKNIFVILFLLVWTTTSVLTLRFTYDTNWISQSEIISAKVNSYFVTNKDSLRGKEIYFIDTSKDSNLPWSPTRTVMTILSNKNYFSVFYPDMAEKVNYVTSGKIQANENIKIIESRQFIGY